MSMLLMMVYLMPNVVFAYVGDGEIEAFCADFRAKPTSWIGVCFCPLTIPAQHGHHNLLVGLDFSQVAGVWS
jgi:hypothetical protein